jgi:hypothetical protein
MAVVINEFEVVPAESQPRPAAPGGGATEAAPGERPKDPQRELDKGLRKRAARATRLMAV